MTFPNFKFERVLWKKGFKIVAGADEVGRGCFAGPVVAATVVFTPYVTKGLKNLRTEEQKIRIDDSKKLSAKQRETADKWIRDNCMAFGIGVATVTEINKRGLSKATASAFRRAVSAINKVQEKRVDYLLVDAFYTPYIRGLRNARMQFRKDRRTGTVHDLHARQLAIIHGDEKSFSIASASIIAKVYRDKLMTKLSNRPNYKKYGWDKNKGYGTKIHQEAIKKYGVSRLHRKKFIETYLSP
ncbi:ribonuclease HII [Candidatus Woesebacteria bacterium RIFCSPLOWO2_01_FULL_39_23]|uniref:Ribonuclease n=1 Tax=Candidatus Woesebacteria bacterium RIFCSPHIGHO2_01_FULL_40_22 TaxID=1802499 RepID=A0A1F7YEW1_9BACT|nr:MAG: ribonuclease HII [Candidatus Woesebacteria bacterium RBG_16_40_11]OGM25861.1 MAG: ribonuclease HII [Candidatus Woesebacteria bacterium RIFCSPHIGHO2_01_FULL_40_22]OGM36239.1 MAG: ribonuclease HII [Candidatus Woesebacteria bacterium RIFCSPHIGHO2_12_FULL_38_9]OGM61615.1 MAG: ribonuclease HII [Candidatus Woesebacteria bacterium RIFCSPLOWO2_01_FULL_39_23]